jgi:hypothetical protein
MADKALIYIPDISGFTQFVTQTEINHIISELIEIIINANELNLQVSEIEGDAVLYYKFGELPSLKAIIDQSKKMFLEFHRFLKIVERDNVCQCGACQSASNLSLKFITHIGEIKEVAIKNFKKLMGSDVILAHFLLKTNVGFPEYLLLTSSYLETQLQRDGLEDWIKFHSHKETYENFGDVNLEIIPFSELQNQVSIIPENNPSTLNRKNKSDAEIEIDAPILKVHQALIDNDLKLKWVPGLRKIKLNSPVNHINSSHTCVFDNMEIHFVTLFNKTIDNEINYAEMGELSPGLSFVSDYTLVEEDGITKLSLQIIPGKINFEGIGILEKITLLIKLKIMVFVSRITAKKNLISFKNFVERYNVEIPKD